MKNILFLSAFLASTAFAENIPVRIECQGPNNSFVRSASKSMGSPYYYDKKTLLMAGTEKNADLYIIQNQNFDLNVGTAHLTGESHTQGYDDAFDLMINFSNGLGTFTHGTTKVPLTNCRSARW